MSFGQFLLKEGMDLELSAELGDVISFLDDVVRLFDFGGHSYRLEPVNGVIGTRWNLAVRASALATPGEADRAVAFIEVGGLGGGVTGLKILSREQWLTCGPQATDQEVKLFSHFAFQLLNALHGEGFLEMPGPLPIE